MKRTVTFTPAVYPGRPPLPPTEGELTTYGLVLHPAFISIRAKHGWFEVSDPVSGALVCHGSTPGRNGAVDALTKFVRDYYRDHPQGDFRVALATAREKLAKPEDFYQPKQ